MDEELKVSLQRNLETARFHAQHAAHVWRQIVELQAQAEGTLKEIERKLASLQPRGL